MAGEIPITRNAVSEDKAEAIRNAVRTAVGVPSTGSGATRLAEVSDASALLDFFSDPALCSVADCGALSDHVPVWTTITLPE